MVSAIATTDSDFAPRAASRWPALQARVVDTIKRAALRRLHRSSAGDAWVLRSYLWVEQIGETSGIEALQRLPAPDWLKEEMRGHLSDENRHVLMIEALLRERGVTAGPARIDPISRLKLARTQRLVREHASRFEAGEVVPTLALGLVMERMGVRYMSRHAEVLRSHAPMTPSLAKLRAIIERVLADERRHVAYFEGALQRLTRDDERAELDALLSRLDAVDRSWSITGAIALFAVSIGVGR